MQATTKAIIIVNYNAGDWLERSVLSALAMSDAEVYVVDNHSTDRSVEQTKIALQETDTLRLHWQLNTENLGFAKANNQILKSVDADYAVLMNPDCELNENTLSLILEQFKQNPKLGLASCSIYNEDGSLQTTCRRKFPTPWSALVRMLQLNKVFPNNPKFANFDYGDVLESTAQNIEFIDAISGAFMVVRKQALKEVGVLDEAYFMHCEDLDWCKRFQNAGWQVGFVAHASVLHAKGVSSKSRPVGVLLNLHKGMNLFFDKHYKNEYSLALRLTVKAGIWSSFVMRAIKSYASSILKV